MCLRNCQQKTGQIYRLQFGTVMLKRWFSRGTKAYDDLPDGQHSHSGTSTPVSSSTPVDMAPVMKRTLNVWGFAFMTYFVVAGGPFGIEVAVRAAGALPVMLGFVLMPFVFALPQALMTAEMSSIIDDNGGYVIWSQVAFGDFAAWISGLNGGIASVFDCALYPALFAEYSTILFDLDSSMEFVLRVAVILVCLAMNIRGLDVVSKVLGVLMITVMSPFFAYFFARIDQVFTTTHFLDTRSSPDWGLFVSTLLWAYNGWDSLGCVAGEVQDPSKTYVRGTFLALLFITLTYLIPVFTASQLHPDFENWDDVSFLRFVGEIGQWVSVWTTVASMASNVGLLNAGLSAHSRAMWALAGGDATSVMPCRHFPSILGVTWQRYGTPVPALIVFSLGVGGLSMLDFETLVGADMLLTAVRLYLEFASFLWLRRKWPHVPRLYKVPGGWPGAWLVTIPKLAVVLLVTVTADAFSWYTFAIVNGLGVIVFLLRWRFTDTYKYDHSVFDNGPNKPNPDGIVRSGSPVNYGTNDPCASDVNNSSSMDDDIPTARLLSSASTDHNGVGSDKPIVQVELC